MLKVSIITVVYNGVNTIESTIQSVLTQDYGNIEYIIIDGGSKDGTLDIIKKYESRLGFFISEKDKGIYDAMNKGIAKATGQIIGFLNSDDFYPDNDIIGSIAAFGSQEDADLMYGNILYVSKDNTNKIIRRWISRPYFKSFFHFGYQIPHPATFIRKRVFEKYGSFNLSLRIASDYELILRFVEKHKVKSAYLNKTIVKMRVGGESNRSISNILKGNSEIYRAWKINGLPFNPLIFILKPFFKVRELIIR